MHNVPRRGTLVRDWSLAGTISNEWEPGRLKFLFSPWAKTVFGYVTRLIRPILLGRDAETLKNPVTRVFIRLRWGAK
jgi:hypothetical protein